MKSFIADIIVPSYFVRALAHFLYQMALKPNYLILISIVIDAMKDTFNLQENRNFIFKAKNLIVQEILGGISQCHLTS